MSTSSRCSGGGMAGLNGTRQCRGGAPTLRAPSNIHAENEERREEEIAQERAAEKHPGRSAAIGRQPHGEGLNQSGKILRVSRIEEPGDRVRNDVENQGRCDRRRQEGLERSAI